MLELIFYVSIFCIEDRKMFYYVDKLSENRVQSSSIRCKFDFLQRFLLLQFNKTLSQCSISAGDKFFTIYIKNLTASFEFNLNWIYCSLC